MARLWPAILEHEVDGYAALRPELDVAFQGSSVAEDMDNLKEALELFFESATHDEIQRRLHAQIYVAQVEVPDG